VAVGAAAGAASLQAAQAAEPGWKHALTDPPPAAPGVEVLYWFPDHGRLQFPVGTQVKFAAVAGLHALRMAGHRYMQASPLCTCCQKQQDAVNNSTAKQQDAIIYPALHVARERIACAGFQESA